MSKTCHRCHDVCLVKHGGLRPPLQTITKTTGCLPCYPISSIAFRLVFFTYFTFHD
ncbi:hypothetical protein CTAM01_00687 [Colletotrichum tamarilloi]|uniref:Uncharacterized protein n=1 Tax=Colletotrichum tamarilloi TaxID=1209934 RepID=A0ABQ9RT58_9PEZI|nr:uncharacterized protein CTAM01_00687 [Colletotrichum tamarilloi]KAK1511757.1 hypothetical protein CTAM01_00687 [Colletotrichum tamarilloi]